MNTEISVLVIEDEELWAAHVTSVLKNYGFSVAAIHDNVVDAMDAFATVDFDIALVDINLNGRNAGLLLGSLLSDKYKKPYIFVSGITDSNLLQQAVEAKPSAYLLKPATAAAIYTSIQLALQHAAESSPSLPGAVAQERDVPDSFFVKLGNSYIKVYWSEIVYLATDKNYTRVFTQNGGQYLLHSSLQRTLQYSVPPLLQARFIQVNRAEAVHMTYIKEIKGDSIVTELRSFAVKDAFEKELKKKLNIIT